MGDGSIGLLFGFSFLLFSEWVRAFFHTSNIFGHYNPWGNGIPIVFVHNHLPRNVALGAVVNLIYGRIFTWKPKEIEDHLTAHSEISKQDKTDWEQNTKVIDIKENLDDYRESKKRLQL